MAVTIGSNIASLKAQRQLSRASDTLSAIYERLSSGQRINKASDDAAGLAIADNLRSRTRVYTQAIRNVNDVSSLLNVTDGALESLTGIVTRQAELAEQAANGTYSRKQRKALENEANALVKEYNRIIDSTSFNGINVFSLDTVSMHAQHGYGTAESTNLALGQKLGTAAGDATFRLATSFGALYALGTAGAKDINGDGNVDLVTSTDGALRVYLGNGDGSFQAEQSYSISGGGSLGNIEDIEFGDFNGDGSIDVTLGGGFSKTIITYLNNGSGTFQTGKSFTTGGGLLYLQHLAVGDLNGDGRDDMVASISVSNVTVLLSNGDGTFAQGQSIYSYSNGGNARDVQLGDLNNDGILDIVHTPAGVNGDVRAFLGTGNGTFGGAVTSQIINNGSTGMAGSLKDLNGDGYLDYVSGETNIVGLGDGSGTFNVVQSFTTTSTGNIYSNPELVDLNGDGIIDILNDPIQDGSVQVRLGNGNGTFTAGYSFATGITMSGIGISLTSADFNNDGVVDFATGTSNICLFLGNSDSSGRRNPYQYTYDFSSAWEARNGLETARRYLDRINGERGNIGALQSRLSIVNNNLGVAVENYESSRSRIVDADIAAESSNLVRQQIVQQSAAAVLAQTNLNPNLALTLLRG